MNEYRSLRYFTDNSCEDFYLYYNLQDLIEKAIVNKEAMFRCRTIAVLQSIHGKFYLTDLDCPAVWSEPAVQMSAVYLKCPPPSTVKPYPVQVFGMVQWMNRPVIFAKILQVLSTANAIRTRNAMKKIAETHQVEPTEVMINES